MPDLVVRAVVQQAGAALHLLITTAYRHFTSRWAWNQWLHLPVMFSDMLGDAVLCLTLWDCCGPGQRQALGGTSVSSRKG